MLTECLVSAAETVQVGSALPHTEIRIHSHMVAKRTADNADGHDFLNSFIADDLAMVAEQAGSGKVGIALREYLRPNSELDRTRRVERLGAVLEATAPRCVPLGRWPSKPEHPLALTPATGGQQRAADARRRCRDVRRERSSRHREDYDAV